MVRLVGDDEVAAAMSEPPTGTRAYFRGRCLEKFGAHVASINWDRIVLKNNRKEHAIDMKRLVDSEWVRRYNQALDDSETLVNFLDVLNEIDANV